MAWMVRCTGEGLSVDAPLGCREWPMGLMVVRGRWGASENVSWCLGCGGGETRGRVNQTKKRRRERRSVLAKLKTQKATTDESKQSRRKKDNHLYGDEDSGVFLCAEELVKTPSPEQNYWSTCDVIWVVLIYIWKRPTLFPAEGINDNETWNTTSTGVSEHTTTWSQRAGGVSVTDKTTLVTHHQVSSVLRLERIHSWDKDEAIRGRLACCSLRTPLDGGLSWTRSPNRHRVITNSRAGNDTHGSLIQPSTTGVLGHSLVPVSWSFTWMKPRRLLMLLSPEWWSQGRVLVLLWQAELERPAQTSRPCRAEPWSTEPDQYGNTAGTRVTPGLCRLMKRFLSNSQTLLVHRSIAAKLRAKCPEKPSV